MNIILQGDIAMKRTPPLLAALALGLTAQVWASQKPVVLLNEADFRDRVFACWLGKNIGGTLGMPFEGKRDPLDLQFYTNLKAGEPAANDDLDLQILWLKAMQDHQGRVDARILGEYWLKYVPVDWNEYGVGKKNMRRGLLPPVSGEFDNSQWKHSNGAWIRSEIWACLAPGCPALAARMAREDACVDHGQAEGTLAEIFTASIESAAFIEKDRDKLLAIGLTMIPKDCQVARAVRAAMAARQAGKDWKSARQDVIAASETTGWFQAPRNVAYTILGWLYGEGDFGRSICLAVDGGDDTDCTGATLGSILGILGGTAGIPVKWSEPIGLGIKTVAISGFQHADDLNSLTDQTVAMARQVLAMNQARVGLTSGPADLRRAKEVRLSDPKAAAALWRLSPWQVVWNDPDFRVTVDYRSQPVIQPNSPRPVTVTLEFLSSKALSIQVAIQDLPKGWQVRNLPDRPIQGRRISRTLDLAVLAPEVGKEGHQMTLTLTAKDKEIRIPLALFPAAGN
jgi:ADP-ribosylglycohydrolase